jgi:hypothetical protein
MVSVLTRIAQYLDGLPGRKNLIWFAGSFPVQMSPSEDDPPDVQQEIKKAIDTLVQARVAVYPIDVRGVVVGRRYVPDRMGLQYANFSERQYLNPSGSGSPGLARSPVRLELAQYPGNSPMPTNSGRGVITNSLFLAIWLRMTLRLQPGVGRFTARMT